MGILNIIDIYNILGLGTELKGCEWNLKYIWHNHTFMEVLQLVDELYALALKLVHPPYYHPNILQ